ncbi:RNA polymerase-binding protein RbpA [Salinibacterium sp. NSLL150]|uniref:RNA polymerase-binding protein RbpA n=1 Tax=unclassified Salinibacterium TaxID=2632331 RepID=UPI0018CD75CD|nr:MULTISPECIES: RNA polymerase-binding protein RbpA [unclassified Salinibacterium]MBH0024225.1 RNA polymerase-binding protein RbpA [Salinibacterium sp. SWN248]MBH0054262.1 RNA polymerase-binding protein RbpA [Salinibacterium sp. SWN139]MBH0083548.1 RNA polymerase-binding protein RbpA [Salinibacterium sp. SWN167]MBH0099190.1 RNA polymerase-binding protein RbpA [Salinibacterium sp. NSLL35]MBH0101944.1 RNA polymerase-binding protein RbpA [Salinibacterium sp. NSLL150]
MADRSLRGMRLGTQSLQSEEGVEFSPRKKSVYKAADGTTFEVMFSSDAEVPQQWLDAKTGHEGTLLDDNGELVELDEVDVKVPRSHWDMLLERRTRPELEELLQERLDFLRARRGQQKIGA